MFSQVIRRDFSSSRNQRAIADLYQKLASWGRKKAPKTLHDPTKESKSQEDLPEDSVPRKLRVLGAPPTKESRWPAVKPLVEFDAWPTRHYNSELSAKEIEAAVSKHYTEAAVSDVQARFVAYKAISKALGIAIPDSTLSTAGSREELVSYLRSIARKYDEKMPDAVYFDPKEFEGTNISFENVSLERKERKKRFAALLKQAQAEERQQAQAALSQPASQ